MRSPVCQRVCAVEGVAARCTTRVSGGHYNIAPDCSFSNAFITIKFELIRDATRLRTNADKGKEAQSIFINAIRVRMESFLLFRIAQKPVAGVPDRNRCRLHRDNAKQEVPGKKEFRQNKCILHTPDFRLLRNGAAKILLA